MLQNKKQYKYKKYYKNIKDGRDKFLGKIRFLLIHSAKQFNVSIAIVNVFVLIAEGKDGVTENYEHTERERQCSFESSRREGLKVKIFV